ncbi:ROK family protein [Kordiimonas marina]|uniref:ROK family protein n=1 Tax=Kordiimonas marina TaxID=2872312 RepID=UPI001FF3AE30|nr:ROK family protein [Kordiimonas marina]
MSEPKLFGAVEGGGTKFVCALCTEDGSVLEEATFPTEAPDRTLGAVAGFFRDHAATRPLTALGVGCFGPVDLNKESPTWGHITATPKPGWSGTSVARPLIDALDCPVLFDTDVNCALLGEAALGAGKGLRDIAYVTIGTGIGGSVMAGGHIVHGAMHPELGHMLVPRHTEDMAFDGSCRFHGGACLEGLAAGPALAARWGTPGQLLPPEHPAWGIEADYLATLCATLSLILSPERIILGGGVMQQDHLFPRVRTALKEKLAGYLPHLQTAADFETYVVPPALGQRAGILGAWKLAVHAL